MWHRIGTWWSIALVRPAAASQIFFVEAYETRKERAIVDGSAEHNATKFAAAAKGLGLSQFSKKVFNLVLTESKNSVYTSRLS